MHRCTPISALLIMMAVVTLPATAQTTVFDFDSGLGSDWEVLNASGLFTVGTTGSDVTISKPADDLSVSPDGFISAGIRSTFCLVGDFTVTVDFDLRDFPPTTSAMLNESVLTVSGSDASRSLLVLRFSTDQQFIEAFSPTAGPLGAQTTSLVMGRYRISRSGDAVSGAFAPAGSTAFQSFGSVAIGTEPFTVTLTGVQGLQAGDTRAANSLEIAFDNVVVEGTIDTGCATTPTEESVWGRIKARYVAE